MRRGNLFRRWVGVGCYGVGRPTTLTRHFAGKQMRHLYAMSGFGGFRIVSFKESKPSFCRNLRHSWYGDAESTGHQREFCPMLPGGVGLFVSLVCLLFSGHVRAENVRIEDVESPMLKAGLEAATEGRLESAERFFQTYISQEDNLSASAYSNLGNVHLQMGKTDLAVSDFTKAIEMAPNAAVPRLNRAIAFEQLGVDADQAGNAKKAVSMWEQGVHDCEEAVKYDPKEFAAWFNKGNIEMRLDKYEEAGMSFSKAADLAPGLAGYRLRAATLLFQNGDIKRCMQQIRGVVRKNGNYAEAHAALSAVLWSTGAEDQAEEELTRAIEMDPVWGDPDAVRKCTRWPPKLYVAHRNLINIGR